MFGLEPVVSFDLLLLAALGLVLNTSEFGSLPFESLSDLGSVLLESVLEFGSLPFMSPSDLGSLLDSVVTDFFSLSLLFSSDSSDSEELLTLESEDSAESFSDLSVNRYSS